MHIYIIFSNGTIENKNITYANRQRHWKMKILKRNYIFTDCLFINNIKCIVFKKYGTSSTFSLHIIMVKDSLFILSFYLPWSTEDNFNSSTNNFNSSIHTIRPNTRNPSQRAMAFIILFKFLFCWRLNSSL